MPGGRRAPIDRALREYARVRRHIGGGRDISLDEAVHVAQRLSRRDFLRLGALAGAGAVLAACDLGPSEETPTAAPSASVGGEPRVVIVGAGLAGMTAAYRLHQAGITPQVFEARDRVGGRCWSSRDWEGGQIAEHGGEFIDTRHVHLRVLIEELGLELDDLWSAWVPGSTWLTFVDGEIVKARDEFREMAPAIDALVELASSGPLGPDGSRASPTEIVAFDEMSAAEWYSSEVGARTTGLYRLWTQRLAGWYGLDPEDLGAGNLIDYYAIDYPGGDERYTVRGGNDQVLERILEELPEGTVTLGTALEGLRASSDGRVEVELAGVAGPMVADRVILAVPFTTLRQVDLDDAGFSTEMRAAIDELGMGTNAKVLLQFDRPFYTGFEDWSGGLDRGDDPIFGTWESGGTDGADRLGLLTVYSGGAVGAGYGPDEPHAVPDRGVVDATLTAVEQAVPGVTEAFMGRAWLDSWADDPWALGSYAAFRPGQMTSFWGAMSRPQGKVHLAGEQTSTYSQGFLNGGVESGSRAAAEVLDALGMSPPPGIVGSERLARRFRAVEPSAN
jgi:monoamine oxidase